MNGEDVATGKDTAVKSRQCQWLGNIEPIPHSSFVVKTGLRARREGRPKHLKANIKTFMHSTNPRIVNDTLRAGLEMSLVLV